MPSMSQRAVLTALCALAVLPAVVRAQALPQPAEIVIAKPAYLALVKETGEDSRLLSIVRQQVESQKHAYNPRCLASLRPDLIAPTIAWAIEPSITLQELDGMRDTSRLANITRQPRVMLSVKAEVLDLLNICTDTIAGTRQITYCESAWVQSPDKACSARYEVFGWAGEQARSTRASVYCDLPRTNLSSILTEMPGQHETIGLAWRETRTLEVLLPPSIKPLYQLPADRQHGLAYEYRVRTSRDRPPEPCVPTASIDELGWPTR